MVETSAWVHNWDPFLIQFSGDFGIRWYGLAYLAGFGLGYWSITQIVKKGHSPLKLPQVGDFITYLFLGVLLGGRLGYCLFYRPELLLDFSASFPFWGALAFWEGGMASHGGILGVAAACYLYSRKSGVPITHLGDLTIFGSALGIFFGRVANFINGELYGRPVQSAVKWAVKFPQEMYQWLDTSHLQLFRAEYQEKLRSLKSLAQEVGPGEGTWLEWVNTYLSSATSRNNVQWQIQEWIQAVQSGSQQVQAGLAEVLTARHPSQLYAGLTEGLIPFFVILFLWRKPRKMGVISATYLAIYPFSRIFNEMFRMPDTHLGFQWLGLTRGQWLSVGMAVMTLSFLVWALRRPGPKVGGWRSTG